MERQFYTISVFTENQVGLLNRLSIIFTRRGLNIESVSASASALPGVHKINFTLMSDAVTIRKVVQQMEKCIDVLRAFAYVDSEIVFQEIALYKVPASRLLDEPNLEHIIRNHNARILEITRDYVVIEKTGHESEIQDLYELLRNYGLLQFVRSGRVFVTRSCDELLNRFLDEEQERSTRTQLSNNQL